MLSSPTVGQVANLRPIANRPAAGPGKFFGCGCQTGLDWIVFNVAHDPAELRVIAHQPVVALTLPERPLESQDSVAFEARESFEGLRHFGDFPQRGNEEMHVIRHYDVGVELVVSLFPKANCLYDHGCYVRHAEIQRPGAPAIENPVHGYEGFSRCSRLREAAICRQASVQSPGEEDGLADAMKMRQAAAGEGGHE
jgi:hypothetical protein